MELPLFVFPHGLRLLESRDGFFPLPVFFTLIFTDPKGEQYYAACLQFYEVVPLAELMEVGKQVFHLQERVIMEPVVADQPSGECVNEPPADESSMDVTNAEGPSRALNNTLVLPEDGTTVYAPKVLCVLSKMPFYR